MVCIPRHSNGLPANVSMCLQSKMVVIVNATNVFHLEEKVSFNIPLCDYRTFIVIFQQLKDSLFVPLSSK